MAKFIVVVLFVAIVFSLFSALRALYRSDGKDTKMVRALTWRIGLSVGLFLLLFIMAGLGWIQPHGMQG